MPLNLTTESKDPQRDRDLQDQVQSRILSDFGTTAPTGEQNGERMGHAVIGGQKRVYFRCPDGSWCYSVLT